jgi:mono/diheme cytochrome c family protein
MVLLVVACGRASEEEIDQALGVTPTPTVDPVEQARATEAAEAQAATAQAEQAMGSASPADGADVAGDENLGNATLGRTKFQFTCQTCHRAGGTAPDLLEPGGEFAQIDYATLYPILREGEGHTGAGMPGAYQTFQLTDADIANIGAYIREQATP